MITLAQSTAGECAPWWWTKAATKCCRDPAGQRRPVRCPRASAGSTPCDNRAQVAQQVTLSGDQTNVVLNFDLSMNRYRSATTVTGTVRGGERWSCCSAR
ncbi:MAG: hypothetical protein R3A10_16995 [Caldilineaceae bacterium]